MSRFSTLAAGAVLVIAATGCGSSNKTGTNAKTGPNVEKVPFTLIDAGCDPVHLELTAGPKTFEVKNDGADAVTEMEIVQDNRILGEVENLAPGLSGSFSITLQPGTYESLCPNGDRAERGEIVVTGSAASTTTAPPGSDATKAVNNYRGFVEAEAAQLVTDTTAFVDAVKAGDVEKAKELFPRARAHYETIEPIAETFGELDAEIDARANDVPAADFKGFHRIEQQLWEKGNTTGMAPVAGELLVNVKKLQALIPTAKLEPAQLANGAVELLNEVARSKITGEEDRYSHTDLWDFAANVDGAKAAFTALKAIVATADAALVTKIDGQFASIDDALGAYKTSAGFKLYTDLTKAQTKALAVQVDALADSLAKVPPIVVAG
jgi:iron uptake system component EfeO